MAGLLRKSLKRKLNKKKPASPGNGIKIIAQLLSSWQTPPKLSPEEKNEEKQQENGQEIFEPAMACAEEAHLEDCRLILDNVAETLQQKMVQIKNDNDAFEGSRKPSMSLNDYLFRLVRYMDKWFKQGASANVKSAGMRSLFLSLVYIEHLQKLIPEFELNEYNVHRLVLVSMLIGAKFTEDVPISNAFWAKVGGIELEQLNYLESVFCCLSEFKLFVDDDELEQLYKEYKFESPVLAAAAH